MNSRKKTSSLLSMTLLRNDEESARSMIEMAKQGDIDAQYSAGLIYAEGRGVKRDLASAYMWLSIADRQGDEDARLLLHILAPTMSEEDYQRGITLLEAWHESGY